MNKISEPWDANVGFFFFFNVLKFILLKYSFLKFVLKYSRFTMLCLYYRVKLSKMKIRTKQLHIESIQRQQTTEMKD